MVKPRVDDPLTADQLRAALDYDPQAGLFTWRYRPNARREWNTRNAGRVAGSVTNRGYIQIAVNGWLYHAHRLAWLWMTGAWPPFEIDHIDNDPGNTRWRNLRAATSSQNKMNMRVRCDNNSGLKGVHWNTRRAAWSAEIWVSGRKSNLGLFPTQQLAHAAYCEAATRLHGAFARFELPTSVDAPGCRRNSPPR